MKNRNRNSIINNDYIESFKKHLTEFEPEDIRIIFITKRLLEAIAAVTAGPQHEYYKYLKKDLNEHKILEYITESIVKNNVPSLATLAIDYNGGIFETFRIHGATIKAAAESLIPEALNKLTLNEKPSLADFEQHDVFERHIFCLKNIHELISLVDQQYILALTISYNKLIDEISLLCDDLKQKLANKTLANGKYLVQVYNGLKHNYTMLASIWGELRLNTLYLDHYNYTIAYLKEVQSQEQKTSHPADCGCKEHTI